MKPFTVVGIDLASSPEYGSKHYNPVGLAALSHDLRPVEDPIAGRFTDDEIVEFVDRHQPRVVAIDSPLSLPANGYWRAVDQEMNRRKFRPYSPLFPSMKALTKRGVALRGTFQGKETDVIEVFPGAAQDVLDIPRKQASRDELTAGLRRLGIAPLPAGLNGHALDAVTAAYVGWCFVRDEYEPLGPPEDVQVIIPRRRAGSTGQRAEVEHIKVWYDTEADFLEVTFQDTPGVFRETGLDQVMAKVDANGRIIGFSILNVSALKGSPLELSLSAAE